MKNLQTFEEFVNESQLNESSDWIAPLTLLLSTSPLIIGSLLGIASHSGLDDIKSPKDLYNDWKKDKIVNKAIERLNADHEIQEFLKLKPSQQKGKWKTLVSSKLSDSEIKHLNIIYRDRVKRGNI